MLPNGVARRHRARADRLSLSDKRKRQLRLVLGCSCDRESARDDAIWKVGQRLAKRANFSLRNGGGRAHSPFLAFLA
eukprot:5822603-Prymnesium_polylepis.1